MAEPTANAELGDTAYGSGSTVTYEAGESITAGDVVGIDGGQLRAANSGDTSPNAIGVAAKDGGSGDNITVYVSGCVVTNVAGTVSAGDELGPSATDGQLAGGSDGFEALTDAGAVAGLSAGFGLGSNAAVVKLP